MPDHGSARLASRVRAEMAARKISGRRLATEMNWRYPHLARRLSGEVPLRAAELGRIAVHLGVPIGQLYDTDSAPAEAVG